MSVLSGIKSYLYNRKFNQIPDRRKIEGRINPSGRIGILYQVTTREHLEVLRHFKQWLIDRDKEVEIILFSPKLPDFEVPEDVYLLVREDLTWYLTPKEAIIEALPRLKFDILLNFNRQQVKPLHFLTALSTADLKLGFYPTDQKVFDILIDVPFHTLKQDISSVKETIQLISV